MPVLNVECVSMFVEIPWIGLTTFSYVWFAMAKDVDVIFICDNLFHDRLCTFCRAA